MLGPSPQPGSPLPDSTTRLAAHLAGRYTLERELGRGGMAVVYRGRDLRHDRPVAIKLLRPELAASLGAERFLREIRFAARLQHPNILPLLDSGDLPAEPGAPPLLWYAMPMVEGESLRDRLRRDGAQPLGDALRWTAELADALGHAHAQGIIHRDIKPENVLLSGTPTHALLADFGVARALETGGGDRLTETGLALGTPAYMSPEQSFGGPVDARSDLYGLGCVLYELLTGEPPYSGPTAQAVATRRLADPVPSARRLRETVPPPLDELVQRLLAKSPADRVASAAELGSALAAISTGQTSPRATDAGSSAPPNPDLTKTAATAARPRPAAFAWRLAAVILVVAAALAAVAVTRRRLRDGDRLDPATVAVLPFRITAPDRSLDYLGEGIVDLLAVKLDGSALHPVPPRELLGYLRYHSGTDVSQETGMAAARRAGAGLVVDGSLVRSGAGVDLSAELRPTGGGGRSVRATASGSVDSLPALVDRLAAQLLVGHNGTGVTTELGELSSAKAVAAWLQGRAAHRRGRYVEAVAHFNEALREDSTFALAALDAMASAERTQDRESIERPRRLAWTYRAKLGPASRVLLRAWLGPKYPDPSSALLLLAAWRDAVRALPASPEAWFELGDQQFHWGGLTDVGHAVTGAQEYFGRALALDSSFVLPLNHLILAKLYLDDTTGLRAAAHLWAAQDTSSGDWSDYVRWTLAIALGDSAAVARERAAIPRWSDDALVWAAGVAPEDAMGLGDVPLVLAEMERRAVTGPRLAGVRQRRLDWLLDTGHPSAALALTDTLAEAEPYPEWARLRRNDDALFWDGDTAAAARDLATLTSRPAPRPADTLAAGVHARAVCRMGIWWLAHGDARRAHVWSARLRALPQVVANEAYNDDDRAVCADLLDASLVWRTNRPEAGRLLDRADSIYRDSDIMIDWYATDLVLARLREAMGDRTGAARTIGRVEVAVPVSRPYLSTYLREQGRLWLAAGDTAGALRSLRRYLALRSDPEERLRAERDSARAALARLVGR
jgi:tetratricopeptide (TPR) repeat protein